MAKGDSPLRCGRSPPSPEGRATHVTEAVRDTPYLNYGGAPWVVTNPRIYSCRRDKPCEINHNDSDK